MERNVKKPTIDDAIETVRAGHMDDSELRESMKVHGWDPRFPAIRDENGVVLIGHRRLKIADELGIELVFQTWKLGKGTDADVERVRLALVSNTGSIAAAAADRKRVAIHLYKTQGWTQERIAKAVGVSQKTISLYLDGIYTGGINSTSDKEVRDKRAANGGSRRGRSKSTETKAEKQAKKQTKVERKTQRGTVAAPKADAARAIIRPWIEQGKPINARALEKEHGISHVTFETAIAAETARLETIETLAGTEMSKSAETKWETIKQARLKVLERQYYERLGEAQDQWKKDVAVPSFKKTLADARKVLEGRKGIMSAATYKLIWTCLHPDSRESVSDEKLNEAFVAFEAVKLLLCNEKEMPTMAPDLPETDVAWDVLAEKVRAQRRQAAVERKHGKTNLK